MLGYAAEAFDNLFNNLNVFIDVSKPLWNSLELEQSCWECHYSLVGCSHDIILTLLGKRSD